MAATVILQPAGRCSWDEPVRIAVRGLAPRQPVTLRASLRDEKGALFRAQARYRADAGGLLDLERAPALGGSFTGLEPMGLLWALEPEKPLVRFVKRDVQTPFAVELEVLDGHEPDAGRVLASLLAGHGFAVLALAYFRFEDLPEYLDDMHLEYFEEAVDFMLQHPKVKGPNVGLLGFSKGGDLCLSMASFLKGITATVLINSCVANTIVALHYKDMIVPSLGSDIGRCTINESGLWNFLDMWDNPLEERNYPSIIPLERAQGPFLFIVGMDDHNWRSDFYAQIAAERLQAHGKDRPQIIYYPGTGHCIEPPYFPPCRASVHTLLNQAVFYGGEPKAQSRAQVDAWQQIQTFFHKHLNGKKSVQSSKI
ncbi:PREDICTED: acyl-coenzyme A thioesterase 6-like isoform 2 [Odobenus rosmarus divergens]|uniref:Acyl-coenzyme A thioesterase 6-like isoform 2 n=1 Tax=Odobenus rosmarus divergens TaxID=9708 RepID=A0A9B0GI34_ODORO